MYGHIVDDKYFNDISLYSILTIFLHSSSLRLKYGKWRERKAIMCVKEAPCNKIERYDDVDDDDSDDDDDEMSCSPVGWLDQDS